MPVLKNIGRLALCVAAFDRLAEKTLLAHA